MDFKANPELASFFELYDLLAVHSQKLFANPGIFDDLEKALESTGIIDELSFNERIFNFARDMREFVIQRENVAAVRELTPEGKKKEENVAKTEILLTPEGKKQFIKLKYPNTQHLFFQPLLMDVLNKVDRRIGNLKEKHLLTCIFIAHCIFAYYMDDNQKIDINKINTIITTKVETVEDHQFYTILTNNKCASEKAIRIFVNLIIAQNEKFDRYITATNFFDSIIKKFIDEMMKNENEKNGNVEDKHVQLQAADPYFPEKLPKIFNLLALLKLLPTIIDKIFVEISPKKSYHIELMRAILSRMENRYMSQELFISNYYKKAVSQIPNDKLRANLELQAISDSDTFPEIINIKHRIQNHFNEWYKTVQVRLLKFFAKKYFGVFDFTVKIEEDKFSVICSRIAKNIVQKTLNYIEEGNNTRVEEEKKKKNELLAQLHFHIFCVGIRQMDSTKQIFPKTNSRTQKSIFHDILDSHWLKIIPDALEKFNEIIAPKEKELLKENSQQRCKFSFIWPYIHFANPTKISQLEMNLLYEAVSEVRSRICDEEPEHNKKLHEQ